MSQETLIFESRKKFTFLILKIILTLPIFIFFFWLVYTRLPANLNTLDFGNSDNLIAFGIIFLIFLFVLLYAVLFIL